MDKVPIISCDTEIWVLLYDSIKCKSWINFTHGN